MLNSIMLLNSDVIVPMFLNKIRRCCTGTWRHAEGLAGVLISAVVPVLSWRCGITLHTALINTRATPCMLLQRQATVTVTVSVGRADILIYDGLLSLLCLLSLCGLRAQGERTPAAWSRCPEACATRCVPPSSRLPAAALVCPPTT